MGQGLNTKMMQIAAYTLNVPFDFIEVGCTSTEKVLYTNAEYILQTIVRRIMLRLQFHATIDTMH